MELELFLLFDLFALLLNFWEGRNCTFASITQPPGYHRSAKTLNISGVTEISIFIAYQEEVEQRL